MAQNEMLKRYLDAGIAFTQISRARAEEIIAELVKAGEVQRDQVQGQVDDLIERSRRNTDQLVALVRQEVTSQFSLLGLATKDDLKNLERRISEKVGGSSGRSSATATATKRAPAATKSAAAKRPAAATKKAAKKATAKATPAKKAASRSGTGTRG